ncbi:hypothetical protein WJX72_008487 [[Myrmecia] bisecta]|uniref:Uncharacterized protein n=1 Tax=[Myrmecia] bisecta TaxID=41462 RepID=A0AAW1PCS9_9CHLO
MLTAGVVLIRMGGKQQSFDDLAMTRKLARQRASRPDASGAAYSNLALPLHKEPAIDARCAKLSSGGADGVNAA